MMSSQRELLLQHSIPLTIIQIYAPDVSYDDTACDEFYNELQDTITSLAPSPRYLLMGDFNARIGNKAYLNWPEVAGRFGTGDINPRGQNLLQLCAINDLVITNTLFKHKDLRPVTWQHPNGTHKSQIDFIITQSDTKSIFKNCRAYQSACIGSDHSLLLANIELIMKTSKPVKRISKGFAVDKFLTDQNSRNEFQIKIGGSFEPLLEINDDDIDINTLYNKFRDTTNEITKDTVGFKRGKQLEGMPLEVEEKCRQRRLARLKMLNHPENEQAKQGYKKINKEVKNAVKKCKSQLLEKKVEQLEDDFKKNNSYNLFKSVREIEGKKKKTLNVVKDKNGKKITNTEKVLKCWEEHFNTHLNTTFPYDPGATDNISDPENITEGNPISLEEIRNAIKKLRVRKAPGIDTICAETLKAGGTAMENMLFKIFNKIWKDEKTPQDWSKMLVSPIHKKGDRLDVSNYRAIAFLSIPGKVFSQILLTRIKITTESKSSESQFGFREGRGTIDAIFVTRQ